MKLGRGCKTARRGFTLVELLVVIAIISVLMSLLLAAVMRVTIKAEEVQTRNDISQLDQAISSFKVKYSVSYIPSRFIIYQKQSDFQKAGKLGQDSFQYINTVWRHIPWLDYTKTPPVEIVHSNWPNGQILEGHQCLVFFLGGPPVGQVIGTATQKAPAGFSTDPTDPFKGPTAGEERVTFYDFPANKLSWNNIRATGNLFPCFLDPYKKVPYAYFSGYKKANDYNRYYASSGPDWDKGSDCISLGVWPYAETLSPTLKYLNPNTHQIIGAGRDKTFGRGYAILTPPDGTNNQNNLWSVKNPLTPGHALYDISGNNKTAGNDDMSNFHELMLGIPAN
jgi:prepilin-type N-terminal cleavage/methylation domain-containing protein